MNEQAKAESAFDRPQRQHVLAVIRYFVKNGWALLRSFWPALAGLAINEQVRMHAEWILLAGFALLCIAAFVEHLKFTFQLGSGGLIIQKGIFERERIVIPFERIQTVHLEQAWWQRPFEVHSLRVDTAGSTGAEIEFGALSSASARELKAALVGREPQPQEFGEIPALIELNARKLLKIGLTQNHFRNAMIAFGAIVAIMEPLADAIEHAVDGMAASWIWVLRFLWVLLIPLGAMALMLIGIGISVMGVFLRYHRLRVVADTEALQMSGGLIRSFEYKLPLHKIQLVETRSGMLQRLVGFSTVKVHQARAEAASSDAGVNLTIPGVEPEQLGNLLGWIFSEVDMERPRELRPASYWWMRRFAVRLMWCMPLVVFGGAIGVGVSLIFLSANLVGLYHHRRRHAMHVFKSEFVLSSGWPIHQTKRAMFFKLQRVALRSNWFMRRRGLVDVFLFTAAGSIVIRHIQVHEGGKLRDWALKEVEQSHAQWM